MRVLSCPPKSILIPRRGIRYAGDMPICLVHALGCVEMAQAEIDNGVNIGAVTMAHNIMATQQVEIDQMSKILGG
jgi:hypothetical protein